MEQEMKKRRRGNDEKEEELKNDSKKRELIGFDSDYDDDNIFKFSDSSSFQPLGVFDFPWLTEEKQPINEPEELKFDDVFSSSLIETSSETSLTEFSGDESCHHHHHRTPFLVEETMTFGNNQLLEAEDEFYDRTSDSRDNEINGVDCIWSSVLNQPLFTRSGKLCHVTDA